VGINRSGTTKPIFNILIGTNTVAIGSPVFVAATRGVGTGLTSGGENWAMQAIRVMLITMNSLKFFTVDFL
jgi:hypothetical protein